MEDEIFSGKTAQLWFIITQSLLSLGVVIKGLVFMSQPLRRWTHNRRRTRGSPVYRLKDINKQKTPPIVSFIVQ